MVPFFYFCKHGTPQPFGQLPWEGSKFAGYKEIYFYPGIIPPSRGFILFRNYLPSTCSHVVFLWINLTITQINPAPIVR